ncbi:methyl-accepting chemotaxis protein, partial [Allorhizobium sp. BGMRC 0089]|uniref:cache domain-containing protein n=1 Tax=Allorhizobium sonneratiae TaxID=2934936 RepID=UPI0020336DAB
MKNLKISRQLLLLVSGLMIAFGVATFFQIRSSAETIYTQRYELLRTEVETAISVLKRYYALQQAGKLSEAEAQKQAFDAVNAMKFQPDGYFFGYDYDVKMLFHPDPKKVGESFKGKADQNGYAYRDDLVKVGRDGGGLVTFFGPKPGMKGNSYRKTSYALAFDPWKVVVVTGLYMDDLDAEVFNDILKAASFGIFVFIFGLGAAFYVIRGISRPLNAIHDALGEVANENTDISIPHTDMSNEVGMMAKATKALQEKVRERHALAEQQQRQQQALDGERQRNAELTAEEARQQAHVVSTIGASLERLSEGDLTVRCADLGERYETLRHNFNDALTRLEQAMTRV